MTQTSVTQPQPIQAPKCRPMVISQPTYNAVKIDIHNPQVNAPGYNPLPEPVTAPMYSYPESKIYEVPKQSIYEPKKDEPKKEEPKQEPVTQPIAVKEVPAVPPPVIVQPTVTQTPVAPVTETPKVAAAPKADEPKKEEPKADVPKTDTPATPQSVEVKAPEVAKPEVDLNAFLAKLANPDFEIQASTMESIADMAQNSPQKATELLDVKVIDALLGIMQSDTSKLEGPSAKQLEIRDKIINGKPVTDAETTEANKVTSMEQAERNKQYAMYTVAILQKLYGSEIEKMNKTIVPLTELPGSAGIVEQVKNNPNPMVRAAGVDALSYVQSPEYKQDLTTIFTVAQKDKDVNVQNAATKALEKLGKLADAPAITVPEPVAKEATPAPIAKDAVPAAEKSKEVVPTPVDKDAAPSPESKEADSAPVAKEATPVADTKTSNPEPTVKKEEIPQQTEVKTA